MPGQDSLEQVDPELIEKHRVKWRSAGTNPWREEQNRSHTCRSARTCGRRNSRWGGRLRASILLACSAQHASTRNSRIPLPVAWRFKVLGQCLLLTARSFGAVACSTKPQPAFRVLGTSTALKFGLRFPKTIAGLRKSLRAGWKRLGTKSAVWERVVGGGECCGRGCLAHSLSNHSLSNHGEWF